MKEPNFNFMKWRMAAAAISGLLIIISITSFFYKGLNFGLDFTGGTVIEVRYSHAADLPAIRKQLTTAGFNNFTAVHFGTDTDVLVRMQATDDLQLGNKVLDVLRENGEQIEKRRIDFVGPQVGDELLNEGGLGLLVSVALMMVYIAIRFQSKFAVGAVVALIHDVIITVGFFSFFGWNFDLTVLAAVLALIGYSLNDSIVVFDRIREVLLKSRKETIIEVINKAINQTLSRTINTGLTTLLTIWALFLFGGEAVHDFSLALMVGMFVGTYSSVYIAAVTLVFTKAQREDLIVAENIEGKKGVYDDGLP